MTLLANVQHLGAVKAIQILESPDKAARSSINKMNCEKKLDTFLGDGKEEHTLPNQSCPAEHTNIFQVDVHRLGGNVGRNHDDNQFH